jgi:hypothetical protein
MKKIIATYSIVIIGLIAFNLIFRFHKSFRENSISYIFSFNKSTQKADAKILGYSFHAHKSQKSSTTFSYDYGLEYSINSKKYFGRYTVVENVDWEYKDYIPLPKSIPILVNKNKPEQFIYLGTHYGKGFLFYFGQLLYLIVSFLLFFHQKEASTKVEIAFTKLKTRINKEHVTALGFLIGVSVPIIIAVFTFLEYKNGKLSDNITGFEIVHKNPMPPLEISNLKQKELDSTAFIYLNADIHNLDKLNSIATITGFGDKNVKRCYIITKQGEKIELEFKYKNEDFDIYQSRDLDQQNSNVYIISESNKYLIPIDMLQYDFEYK